jgi:hypothetical protein
MSCGGSHLGYRIGIKNANCLEDLQMIIPGQFGFNCPSSRHFPFYIGTKNLNFVEDHPMNIPV